jgi:hypothetical protein
MQPSLTTQTGLPTAAAAAALQFGKIDLALEWLEQGHCLVWNQLNGLRMPVDDLRAKDPNLAEESLTVARALESDGSRMEMEMDNAGSKASSLKQRISIQDEVTGHIKLAQQWDQLLAKVREIHGFHNFLRPLRLASFLSRLLPDGPVVIINAHPGSCGALALVAGQDAPYHIPLTKISFKTANDLRKRLQVCLSYGVRARGEDLNESRAVRRIKTTESTIVQEILKEL